MDFNDPAIKRAINSGFLGRPVRTPWHKRWWFVVPVSVVSALLALMYGVATTAYVYKFWTEVVF